MADRGRDLKVSILSDASRFDATEPADQLDQLADAAGITRDELVQLARDSDDSADVLRRLALRAADAQDELRELDRTTDRTGAAVDQLGDDSAQVAKRVDASFDKIAAASKRTARDVDHASDRAGESLRDMGDEGTDTAREMAASFDGTSDGIQDAMQEAATNVLATLGPLGAAVGVAGGMALGFLRGQAEQLKEAVSDVVGQLLDQGSNSRQALVTDRLRQLAEEGTILDLANQARTAKVDVSDYLRAVAGDPDAIERTRAALWKYSTEMGASTEAYTAGGMAAAAMRDELNRSEEVWRLASDAVDSMTQALPPGVQAQTAFNDAVAGYTSVGGTYADLLARKEEKERESAQATADATEDQSDSWEDYADAVAVSVDDYLAELTRQVEAQEEWAANLEALARRGVEEGVLAELASLGPEGAPLVASLTTATDAELAELVRLFRRRGGESTDGLAAALTSGKSGVTGAARLLWQDTQAALDSPLLIPTSVVPPAGFMLSAARQAIQAGLGTVRVPVMLQNVPQSVWATPRYSG